MCSEFHGMEWNGMESGAKFGVWNGMEWNRSIAMELEWKWNRKPRGIHGMEFSTESNSMKKFPAEVNANINLKKLDFRPKLLKI